MDKAKIFMNGRSQAVRLPKKYRFKEKEVYIKKTDDGILLIPKSNSVWDIWERNIMKYDDKFMDERNQPEQQERHELNALFD